jgi:hypothetical protein
MRLIGRLGGVCARVGIPAAGKPSNTAAIAACSGLRRITPLFLLVGARFRVFFSSLSARSAVNSRLVAYFSNHSISALSFES